jgi:hypothetical protein
VQLPLSWLGVPAKRTKILLTDGVPHPEVCQWISLGPLDLGVGRFQEISCLHQPSGALVLTDALVGIHSKPPAIFDRDPTPLLFHARDRGDQPLSDSPETRRRGWARLVLFASYLRPHCLRVPAMAELLRYAFRPGLRSWKAHFGVYPFDWQDGWQEDADALMGDDEAKVQVAPVLERLVLPRAQQAITSWLEQLESLSGLTWVIPAHYSAPLSFSTQQASALRTEILQKNWAPSQDNWEFLSGIDQQLLDLNVVPKNPIIKG